MNPIEESFHSSKWELRGKREAQEGIETLRASQDGAQRQEGQGCSGLERLKEATGLAGSP